MVPSVKVIPTINVQTNSALHTRYHGESEKPVQR
jgi:hypothetical protein